MAAPVLRVMEVENPVLEVLGVAEEVAAPVLGVMEVENPVLEVLGVAAMV